MKKKIESVNWPELDAIISNGIRVAGRIYCKIELLIKNMGKKSDEFAKFASDIEVPIGLARKIIKKKTVEEAFELWRMTYLKKAFKALKKGVDLDKVKAKTNLSTAALEFLKSMNEMPKKGKALKLLKRFAYMEDYLGEIDDYVAK
ncbi:MAG: hypothetical protein LBT59_17120 [Clostridiales bacterium]|jgi:hypothetical protein|nr:hypothetical protein [Clostridiales bacterium]